MKRAIAILLLIAASIFAQDGTGTSSDTSAHFRNGLYFSTGLTLGYTYFRSSFSTDIGYSETYTSRGFIPYADIRLGRSFANTFAIYGLVGFGVGTSTLEYQYNPYDRPKRKKGEEYDGATFIRMALGTGLEYHTAKIANGSFVGIALGVALEGVEGSPNGPSEYHSYEVSESEKETMFSFFARLEAGKDWWIGRHWTFGTALSYTIGTFDYETGSDHDTYEVSSHLVGIALRFTH